MGKEKLSFKEVHHSHSPKTTLWWFFLVATCIKVLLFPSYRSTDFEVHRNWLALTHSLPLSQWYFDETSPWTLDYPPFFAYFERFLSIFAHLIDPQIVHLQNGLNYSSNKVVYFQRVTVILSDLSLLYGVYRLTRNLDSRKQQLIWSLVIWSPMLFIVDHVHFQYNGFLIGILLISLSYLEEGRDLLGGFVFAVLLCFKHLFAVAAPIYFVYLLRHYCWGGMVRGFRRLLIMGGVVTAVFASAFGPFFHLGQIQQVIQRLFPFGRGLCHAYWAPNFWVFYIMSDKGLAFIFRKLGFNVQTPTGSFTAGLVGDSSPFSVLPQIKPSVTFIMVLLALSPCLFKAWKNPQPQMISRWIAYAYTCGFLFGWHVHEKASLHFVIPLAIVAAQTLEDARHYFLLSIVSCYSIFPLLFEAREYPIKVLLLLLHSILMWSGFSAQFYDGAEATRVPTANSKKKADQFGSEGNSGATVKKGFAIGWIERIYLIGLVVVEIWGQILHPLLFGDKFAFAPLMLISIYCAFGIMYSWIWQLIYIVKCR
ncbi:probable dolichyl pyrophosphate Glc1Man9GlcNAc2 alpha-1,3-glucosyltransferase [Glycine soja]|uniref:Alpha-1,3-glucosyltransferase n=1 Tax=Glycine soja TaxID=3848 RepID=A0A445JC92_GLYSO|nr:probable dolichyl pyrophosphate Glc1Man9GlcNAc2 alpha-1,3-glucosyltransferase [Glycine soja]XP_028243385.1 probable dolichyl pyrophosphate Glc1Man9GlcNAc2 alpha-1,3-glucosyltransferase [Glycine soja]KHN12438.1 Putative dolichyl pyrophosphate Glc1Man9GlcNAc2 alpha-1,3-glucosyltransferase [Glycine soja]RZB96121.1 putative dolichyl pyrophosphate Glc1Man9GlcNAc2 alpha-1,3-glucosyltransferase isoform A [Glycine soja]RZB96122.1 putative dolichyl pyrophosphate Glc1Man9GlcNAc2 alpha-1,3-glucosyltran